MKPRSQFVRWSIAGTLLLLLTGFALRQYLLSYELRMLSQASQQVMADVQSILRLSTAYADEENLDPDQLLALIGYNYRLTMTAQPALAYVYIQSPWGLRLTHYIRPGLDFSRVTLEEIQAPLIHDRRFLGIARFGINMNELRTSARMKRNQLSQILTAAVIGTLLLAVGSVTLITIFARRRQRAAQTRAREQHLAEVGTLVSGLAHEIRNPLGPIK